MLVEVKPKIWTPERAEVCLHNHFKAEIFDRRSGKREFEAEAYNVVLDQARVLLATQGGIISGGTNIMSGCAVGSGTGPPSPTNTALGSQRSIAGIATSSQIANPTSIDTTTGNWFIRKKYYFSETVANFSLTEVGLYGAGNVTGGSSANTTAISGQFSTRALFKDANGNAISVTKDNTQVLVITATVYLTRGQVATNMRLLNNFFVKQLSSSNHSYGDWYLGNGSALANDDVQLAGTQLARRSDSSGTSANVLNRVFWDSSTGLWFYPSGGSRPAGKTMITAYAQDWDTNEGNVTFSEVLLRTVSFNSSSGANADSIVHLAFPCGTVGTSTFSKTNANKMRQYLEISW